MSWLKIENINKNLYTLKGNDDVIYQVALKFMDIDILPNIGDAIFINDELLNQNYEGYSTFYTFGDLKSTYGKANISLDDIDVIKLRINGKVNILKRLYG